MTTRKITSRGQVTLPSAVRKQLGVKPGDLVHFRQTAAGEVVIEAAEISLCSLFGSLRSDRSLTLQAMDEAVGRGAMSGNVED